MNKAGVCPSSNGKKLESNVDAVSLRRSNIQDNGEALATKANTSTTSWNLKNRSLKTAGAGLYE